MTREERIVLLNGFRADKNDEYAVIIEKAIQEELEDYENIVEIEKEHKKENGRLRQIIDKMAENMTTPIHNKKWVIDYFENEVK